MPNEKSAGLVVFRFNGIPHFLLLKSENGNWGFPKGNIEAGESEKEAAVRETQEETGITNLKFIDNFKESIEYFYREAKKTIHKQVIYFLAETKETKIKISSEHIGYEWLTLHDALKRLNYDNDRNILKKAKQSINNFFTS